jgi:hypothetical protein
LRIGGGYRGGLGYARGGYYRGGYIGGHVYIGARTLWGYPHWGRGFWHWGGASWLWVAGPFWVTPAYPDWIWIAPQWIWDGGEWVWQEGYWAPAY